MKPQPTNQPVQFVIPRMNRAKIRTSSVIEKKNNNFRT